MDLTEAEAEAVLDRLAVRGVVEERDGEVRATRDWNLRLRRAGEELNEEVARVGREPEGNPLVLAVRRALAPDGFAGRELDVAVHLVVLLELARMTPEERRKLRFPAEPL